MSKRGRIKKDNTMTTSEAGRKGGEKTARTHGKEFYQEIGRKGGETVSQEKGPEFYSKIGKQGGEASHSGGRRKQE